MKKKNGGAPKYGSLEWLETIATILGERLIGIELIDNKKWKMSPQLHSILVVRFLMPFDYNQIHSSVRECAKLEGFRELTPLNRVGEMVQGVTFYFTDRKFYPRIRNLQKTAKNHGLSYKPKELNTTTKREGITYWTWLSTKLQK